MNERHLQLCASAEWAEIVQHEILPWAVGDRDLGQDVLEVGPGPGQTTDVLRQQIRHLTAVEVDPVLASRLGERLKGTNVAVVNADATALPFGDGRFSAATSFTMLHHLPSVEAQDSLLREVRRVLRPDGLLIGVDSIDRPEWRELHVGDTCVPVQPSELRERLRLAGYVDVEVALESRPEADGPARRFRFAARNAIS